MSDGDSGEESTADPAPRAGGGLTDFGHPRRGRTDIVSAFRPYASFRAPGYCTYPGCRLRSARARLERFENDADVAQGSGAGDDLPAVSGPPPGLPVGHTDLQRRDMWRGEGVPGGVMRYGDFQYNLAYCHEHLGRVYHDVAVHDGYKRTTRSKWQRFVAGRPAPHEYVRLSRHIFRWWQQNPEKSGDWPPPDCDELAGWFTEDSYSSELSDSNE